MLKLCWVMVNLVHSNYKTCVVLIVSIPWKQQQKCVLSMKQFINLFLDCVARMKEEKSKTLSIMCSIQLFFSSCLSTFLTLNESFPPHSCQNLFHSNASCPNNCSASLNTTLHTMGCCYNLILNNTAYTSTTNISASFSSDYWNNCGIHPPSDHCVCTYSSIGGTYSLQSNNFANNLILLLLLLATSNII